MRFRSIYLSIYLIGVNPICPSIYLVTDCDGAIRYLSHFKAYEVRNKRLNIPGRATIRKRMGTRAIKYFMQHGALFFAHVKTEQPGTWSLAE